MPLGDRESKSRCLRHLDAAVRPTEIRVLDYIEGQGQVLGYYTQELHHRGYDKALCTLPHDGMNANAITGLKYADQLRDAGFSVTVVPNQGAGAAAQRIEAVRRLFTKCWFNETTTEAVTSHWSQLSRRA
jgi:phage terminase large subunit